MRNEYTPIRIPTVWIVVMAVVVILFIGALFLPHTGKNPSHNLRMITEAWTRIVQLEQRIEGLEQQIKTLEQRLEKHNPE